MSSRAAKAARDLTTRAKITRTTEGDQFTQCEVPRFARNDRALVHQVAQCVAPHQKWRMARTTRGRKARRLRAFVKDTAAVNPIESSKRKTPRVCAARNHN